MKRVSQQSKKDEIKSTSPKSLLKKIWHFLWYEDSIYSWIANIVLAFILIKFIVYPALSFMLGTGLPIVAVVSGSMEHRFAPVCEKYLSNGLCASYSSTRFDACGVSAPAYLRLNQSAYWSYCGKWYESHNITQDAFQTYRFSSGFNTGDVMVVRGKSWSTLAIGDVIVWIAPDGTPIIHRIVAIQLHNGVKTLETKGDHNADQIMSGLRAETKITQSQYVGVATLRIPYLGYVKLWAARAIGYMRG